MLRVVVRHQPPCRETDPDYRGCKCRKYIVGVPDGSKGRIRVTANTRSWERAEKKARAMDLESMNRSLGVSTQPKPQSLAIKEAVQQYLQKKRNENASDETLAVYELVLHKQFLTWCTEHGLSYLDQLTGETLMPVTELWTKGRRRNRNGEVSGNNSNTASQKYTKVSGFLNYWVERGVLSRNPLRSAFRRPKVKEDDTRETQPLEPGEMKQLIDRTYLPIVGQKHGAMHRLKQRALLLLMRYSGLAILDAAKLAREKLGPSYDLPQDAIELRRTKTGKPVYVLIPPRVAELLRSLPNENPAFFFWDGKTSNRTLTDNWRQSLKRLASLAEVRGFHPHRLRCSFAVEQLLRGTAIEDIADLLGNTVEVAAKHYAPLARQRRERLGKIASLAWDDDKIWQEPNQGVVLQ
jgi:site-specific recombinase XerD